MSENILTLIPTNPDYVPPAEARQTALQVFKAFVPQGEDITVRVADDVEFVDIGDNLERIICPVCGSSLDVGWWIQAMDAAYEESRFANLTVIVPCCSSLCSLNDLQYDWPTGFTRFRLEAHNPNIDMSEHAIHSLELIVRCRLRKIWAHF